MAAFNISLDDSSPLISYYGSWLDTPAGDNLAANYSGASLHQTNVTGAKATLTFNGTGVWFYGGHRPGYGNYSLAIDGHAVANGSAASSTPVLDQLLGGVFNLNMGQHTAVLSSVGGTIDIDNLIFETQIGSPNTQVNQTTVEDSDAQISYLPAPAWHVADKSYFANGSAHYTVTNGSQATLSFSGDAVAVHGGVSFDHGPYTVSIDGQSHEYNGGGYRGYHAQTVLFFGQGLGAGSHHLTLTSVSGFLDLDNVVVYSTTGKSTTTLSSSATPLPTTVTNGGSGGNQNTFHVNQSSPPGNNAAGSATGVKSISPAVLSAIIAACVIGLASLVLIAIFIAQQIRNRHKAAAAADVEAPVLVVQNSDVEAGPRVHFEKEVVAEERSHNSRSTVHSISSRWSQASFANIARFEHVSPPIPTPSAGADWLTVPVLTTRRPTSQPNTYSISSSETLYSRDGHGSQYHQMMGERAYSHRSIVTFDSSNVSVAPQRPARPADLELGDLEHIEL